MGARTRSGVQVMRRLTRSTLVLALAAAAMWLGMASAQAQQPGLVMGAIPSGGGIGLVAFVGTVDGLRSSAQSEGCQLESVWATVGGRFVGHTFGRPAFVNAGFASEVGTVLRSDQVLLVVCGAGTPTSPPTAAPPPDTPPPPAATPPPAAPPSGSPAPPFSATPLYDPEGPDLSCSDFPTQADAQILFEAAGGPGQDRHGLDPDGNGLACEDLP